MMMSSGSLRSGSLSKLRDRVSRRSLNVKKPIDKHPVDQLLDHLGERGPFGRIVRLEADVFQGGDEHGAEAFTQPIFAAILGGLKQIAQVLAILIRQPGHGKPLGGAAKMRASSARDAGSATAF